MANIRATQQVVRVLGSLSSPLRCTSIVVRVLGKRNPCVPHKCPPWMLESLKRDWHRFAALWEIERHDGQVFYFTDHNGELVGGDGNTYTPSGGPAASAREHESGEREHSVELTGALVIGGATMDELEASLWDDAKVTESIVDWRYPQWGCHRHHRWYTRDIQQDGEQWTAQLAGISSRFEGPRLSIRARDCTHNLGDQEGVPAVVGCHFAVSATLESSAVDTVVSSRRTFTATLAAAHIADYFVNAELTWTSGDNVGIVSVVRKATEVSAGSYQIEVELSLSEDIQVADTFDILQGCQKRWTEDCTPKGQTADHNGNRRMPGVDGLKVNPSVT